MTIPVDKIRKKKEVGNSLPNHENLPAAARQSQPAMKKRPGGVTLLSILVLITAVIHLVRLAQALANWGSLSSLPGISPLYLALTGLFWSLTGLPVYWALWKGLARSGWAARVFFLAYSLYFWLDRIFVARSLSLADKSYDLPFLIGFNLILFILFFGILSRPRVKQYLGEIHADRSENKKT